MSGTANSLVFLLRGGFMMYPLLLSGFVALVIIIERIWLLKGKLSTAKKVVNQVLELVRNGSADQAAKLIADSKSPVLCVIEAGLKDLAAPLDELELTLQNTAEMWIPIVEKRLEVLDTVITAAPLMGLLGTITGMMSAFQVLSENGVNEPGAITGGVAEALIATATGLVIALVTLVAYNYLNKAIKDLIFEMESGSSRLIEARKFANRQSL